MVNGSLSPREETTGASHPLTGGDGQPAKESEKLGFVDCARAIAILSVIVAHAVQPFKTGIPPLLWSVIQAGQYGVQLFFVASAFTLCLSWNRNSRLIDFYVHRIFRVLPMYWVGIAIYQFLNLKQLPRNGLDISLNLVFLHGVVPSAHNSVVPGGWSIGTEVLFYLTFPGVVFILNHVVNRVSQEGDWYSDLIIPVIAVTCAVFVATFWTWSPQLSEFRYHSLIYQFPVFILGIWVYFRPLFCFRKDVVAAILLLLAATLLMPVKSGSGLLLGWAAATFLRFLLKWGDLLSTPG